MNYASNVYKSTQTSRRYYLKEYMSKYSYYVISLEFWVSNYKRNRIFTPKFNNNKIIAKLILTDAVWFLWYILILYIENEPPPLASIQHSSKHFIIRNVTVGAYGLNSQITWNFYHI